MKIDYKITEVRDRVFAVTIEDAYDRAMTFCRVQEFYESPNPDFRGKHFNIWDYIEWYSRTKKGAFTYAFDWGGFNIPLPVALECYEGKENRNPRKGYNGVRSMPDTWKSKWDETMKDIVWAVESRMFNKKNRRDYNAYIIGAKDMEGDTFQHEVAHGLYYTNKEYRELMDEITQTIPLKDYTKFRQNLLDMGYTESVIDDEIQAYLSWGWDYAKFSKGVSKKLCKQLNKEYRKVFNRYL
jgi:hypothetical protein